MPVKLDILSHEKVTPAEMVTEFVDAVEKYERRRLSEELNTEGDVVLREVPLSIPRRRDGTHPKVTHLAALLVRRAGDTAHLDPKRRTNQVALYRGRRMVVRYLDLKQIGLAAFSFHSVLLSGLAKGEEPADQAAEEFLRTAEPPAHNDWLVTPDLKTEYQQGGGRSITLFFDEVKRTIRELVRPQVDEASDGPELLRELLRFGRRDTASSDRAEPIVRLGEVIGEVTDGCWVVEGEIRARSDRETLRVRPILRFAADTGVGEVAPWAMIKPLTGCFLAPDGATLVIPPGTRIAKFSGLSDPEKHPGPVEECAVTVDLRQDSVTERED